MNDTLQSLKQRRAAIAALDKISQKCDPASGVSFSVRRGVSRDNEDLPGDAINRPWVTVEVGDAAGIQAIEVLILAMRASEQYWKCMLERETQEAVDYLSNGGAS